MEQRESKGGDGASTAAPGRTDQRVIMSSQGPYIRLGKGSPVLNLTSNDYLGLAQHSLVQVAAREALSKWGAGPALEPHTGLTQGVHQQLEQKLSEFLGTEDTLIFASAYEASRSVMEDLLDGGDLALTEEGSHPGLQDGARRSGARCATYVNEDLGSLESRLKDAGAARRRVVATDGVFPMDGRVANLSGVMELAQRHGAILVVDDSHGVGFMGKKGRGTHEFHELTGRVDVLTGSLAHALGAATGGYASGRREIIQDLRARSRAHLYGNALAPSVAGGVVAALEVLAGNQNLRDKAQQNAQLFRNGANRLGFNVLPGFHPICPVVLGDAGFAARFVEGLLAKGVCATAFVPPLVPKYQARLRVQVSALHSKDDIDSALRAFSEVRGVLDRP